MKRMFSSVFNTFAITVGLAAVFLISAIKRIEDRHDDRNFWE